MTNVVNVLQGRKLRASVLAVVTASASLLAMVSMSTPAAATTYFLDSFDGGLGAWTVAGNGGAVAWHEALYGTDPCFGVGNHPPSPVTGMGSTAAYHADGTCTYDNGAANWGTITTNAGILLPSSPLIRLYLASWHEVEPGFETLFVQVSSDGGMTWSTLVDVAASYMPVTWNLVQLDVTPYAGSTVWLRFYLDTYDPGANAFAGWHIDEV